MVGLLAAAIAQGEVGILQELAHTWELFKDSLLATLVLSTALAFLGVHVVLRRVVFVGLALSELAALGVAGAFFAERFPATAPDRALGFLREHVLMGALANFSGLAFLIPSERRLLSRETRIAVCFTAAGALALLLVAGSPHGMDELQILMTGDPLFVSHQNVQVMFATMIPATLVLLIFFRRFLLVAFDREMAQSLGVNVRAWDTAFYLLLGLAVAMSIHLAGMLFAVGYLVLPGAGALSVARRPWTIFAFAAGIGLLSSAAGFFVSYQMDWPLGATTVTAAFVAYLCMLVVRRLSVRIAAAE